MLYLHKLKIIFVCLLMVLNLFFFTSCGNKNEINSNSKEEGKNDNMVLLPSFKDVSRNVFPSTVSISIKSNKSAVGVIAFEDDENLYVLSIASSFNYNGAESEEFKIIYYDSDGNGIYESTGSIYKIDYNKNISIFKAGKVKNYNVAKLADISEMEKGDNIITLFAIGNECYISNGIFIGEKKHNKLNLKEVEINVNTYSNTIFNDKGELLGVSLPKDYNEYTVFVPVEYYISLFNS